MAGYSTDGRQPPKFGKKNSFFYEIITVFLRYGNKLLFLKIVMFRNFIVR